MNTTTIAANLIEEGMKIAKDIVTTDGILLIPKNTTITSGHIVKINIYNISKIDVYDQAPIVDLSPRVHYETIRPIEETAAFLEFSFRYDQQVKEVKTHLNHIVETGEVDQVALNQMASDIIQKAVNQRDLFSYMCRLKSSDNVTFSHSMNVSLLASVYGKWLNLTDQNIQDLALAGLLHDIGKVKLDQNVLNKKGTLTDAEFSHLKQHTTLGYRLVADANLPSGIKQAVLMHHEKMNGAGYPLGLAWDKIHDYAKIIAIVDIYDAMTSERPYHSRYHPFQVIRMFEEECYGILDTKYLYVFLERIAHNFLNTKVLLSNKEEGTIIFIHRQTPSKPMIQLSNGTILDLMNHPELEIDAFV